MHACARQRRPAHLRIWRRWRAYTECEWSVREFQFEASGWAVAPGLLRSERAPLRATRSAPLSYAIAAQCDDMRRAGAADGVDRIDLG